MMWLTPSANFDEDRLRWPRRFSGFDRYSPNRPRRIRIWGPHQMSRPPLARLEASVFLEELLKRIDKGTADRCAVLDGGEPRQRLEVDAGAI